MHLLQGAALSEVGHGAEPQELEAAAGAGADNARPRRIVAQDLALLHRPPERVLLLPALRHVHLVLRHVDELKAGGAPRHRLGQRQLRGRSKRAIAHCRGRRRDAAELAGCPLSEAGCALPAGGWHVALRGLLALIQPSLSVPKFRNHSFSFNLYSEAVAFRGKLAQHPLNSLHELAAVCLAVVLRAPLCAYVATLDCTSRPHCSLEQVLG
mmetsp:Transcript_37922/g.109380  ORF Transcript_37922/g.109380 Transcript_37922/m.109380 type:complete len:211 (-) Transcript_37922:2028-2660(-)